MLASATTSTPWPAAFSAAMLGAWCLGAWTSSRAAKTLSVTVTPPDRVFTQPGHSYPLVIELRGAGSGPLLLDFGSARTWVPAATSGTRTLTLDMPCTPRGLTLLPPLTVLHADPLGLWWAATQFASPTPHIWMLPPPARHARLNTPGEPDHLRPYRPGDPAGRVSWKASARTGALITRTSVFATPDTLRWDDATGSDDERAGQLSAQVQDAGAHGSPFTLELPGARERVTLSGTPAGVTEALQRIAAVNGGRTQLALLASTPLPPDPEALTPDARQLRAALLALTLCTVCDLQWQRAWVVLLSALPLLLSWAQVQGRGSARRWPLLPFALALGAAVAAGSIATPERLPEGLLLSFGNLKALELRTPRDVRMLLLFGLLSLIAGQIGAPSLTAPGPLAALAAAGTLLCFLAVGAALLLMRPGALSVPPRARMQGTPQLLLALPVAALLALLHLPNVFGSDGRSASHRSVSGLAENVDPGSVSALALSSEHVMSATFVREPPRPADRYFRGPVLEHFDGRRWSADAQAQTARQDAPPALLTPQGGADQGPSDQVLVYALSFDNPAPRWIPALEPVTLIPPGTHLDALGSLRVDDPANAPTAVILGQLNHQDAAPLNASERQRNLQLPPGNPRVQALARSWRALPPEARLQSALDFLRHDHLDYTLNPALLRTTDTADETLFTTKQGFCEHFASSFAVMLRAAGLPTRLVSGYLGGTLRAPNGDGPRWTVDVLQSDAHVWNEVWLEHRGWVRVDPTDAANTEFITLDRHRNFKALRAWAALALLAAILAGGLWWRAWSRSKPPPAAPLLRAYLRATRRLRLPMQVGETPLEYARRAASHHPEQGAAIHAVTRQYLELRYGPQGDAQDPRGAARTLARTVRSLLRRPGPRRPHAGARRPAPD